MKFSETVIPVK